MLSGSGNMVTESDILATKSISGFSENENDTKNPFDLSLDLSNILSLSFTNDTDYDYDTNSSAFNSSNSTKNFFGYTDYFEEETSQWIQFTLAGILLTIVAFLGVLGNILSISVLCQKKMRSSLSVLLISLSICDLIVCVLMAVAFGVPQILIEVDIASDYLGWACEAKRYLFPVLSTVQLGSTYFTVAITMERFIAVCLPLRSRSICTYRNAIIGTILIPILCALVYVPTFVTYSAREESYDLLTHLCKSKPNNTGTHGAWRVARMIIYIVIPYFIPMATVIIVNVFIVRTICQKNAERDNYSQHQLKEIKLTRMLVVVVIVYVVCNVFRLVNTVTNTVLDVTYAEVASLTNFLVTFNSAVNYLIYCAYGKSFRQSFVTLFCKCGNGRKLQRSFKGDFDETVTTEMSILKSIRRFSKSFMTSFDN